MNSSHWASLETAAQAEIKAKATINPLILSSCCRQLKGLVRNDMHSLKDFEFLSEICFANRLVILILTIFDFLLWEHTQTTLPF